MAIDPSQMTQLPLPMGGAPAGALPAPKPPKKRVRPNPGGKFELPIDGPKHPHEQVLEALTNRFYRDQAILRAFAVAKDGRPLLQQALSDEDKMAQFMDTAMRMQDIEAIEKNPETKGQSSGFVAKMVEKMLANQGGEVGG